MGQIRVIAADDEDVILRTLADVIATDAALELVGVARDAEDAIALAVAQAGDRPLAWPGRRAIRSEEPVPAMRVPRNGSLDLSTDGSRG